jgi:hypothetical protein
MMIGMIIVFFPGLFLGSKYGLFAGIMGAMFGLSLTYMFPSIGLPVSIQILVGVGMVFALFFGSQKWGSGKKSD